MPLFLGKYPLRPSNFLTPKRENLQASRFHGCFTEIPFALPVTRNGQNGNDVLLQPEGLETQHNVFRVIESSSEEEFGSIHPQREVNRRHHTRCNIRFQVTTILYSIFYKATSNKGNEMIVQWMFTYSFFRWLWLLVGCNKEYHKIHPIDHFVVTLNKNFVLYGMVL